MATKLKQFSIVVEYFKNYIKLIYVYSTIRTRTIDTSLQLGLH